MKIVIIGTVAPSFYLFRAELIKSLRTKQHTIYAFTSEYTQNDLDKIEDLGAIPITYELNRSSLNPLKDIKTTYALSRKIKDISPDLVFCYFAKPVIFGTLAAKIAKVPRIIGMLEGLGYAFTEQPKGLKKKIALVKKIQVYLYRIALPQLDRLVFLNPDDPKDLLHRYSIRVNQFDVLGGIGLNLNEYTYQPIKNINSHIKFLFIGRLFKEKGIHEFIAAARQVRQRYHNAQFTVLGEVDSSSLGALRQSELDDVISSGLINYPGQVDNVQDWIGGNHVFVLPSYREGVPRSTQEAMAIGRAVITTDVPGCRETVVNGVNGFLVERWNPQALAEKMIYFIENPEQIKIMGDESYKIAQEKFDADKVNTRLLGILGL
ncbi:glycosyltransferase family 4 protein [uncultured Psychrobacter sp.]|uniref:glycosyltransferase family 4 protein n=1 Tax=uncultured Psychrobacter sp. TaxID=259303 RepID=UPI00262162EC|nr:glycosyltransferase family 4 protein [uncultured Psychrobacter sp.]